MAEEINHLENIAEGKVYTIKAIVVSAFFGGLLAGGYMLYQNFKTLGDNKKAVATIFISIFALIANIATAFMPALSNVPAFVYTLAITLATSLLANKFQRSLIEKHISAGGKVYPTQRAVLICVISIILIVAFILGLFLLQDASVTL